MVEWNPSISYVAATSVALVSTTWSLWTRHFTVFFTLALIVVAPVGLLVDGVWGGTLADPEAQPSPAAAIAGGLLNAFVVSALITAVHVVAVQGLGRGEAPSIGSALRGAAPAFLPVMLVIVLYTLGTGLLMLALVLPGIWFATKYYFGAQAAIVDGERATGALSRSGELVAGNWWRTFGILLVFGLLAGVIAGLVGLLLGFAAGALESGPLMVSALIIGNALAYSFTALAGTLLFFDLRARKSLSWEGEPTRPVGDAPEHPSSA